MQIVATTANDLYVKTMWHVLRNGQVSRPRAMETKELLGASLVLINPAMNVVTLEERKINYHFQVAEWLWIMLGRNDTETIGWYNKQISKFSDDGRRFNGAYGPKFVEQLAYVLMALTTDPDTRQAVMSFWRERPGTSKDVPCTLTLQFLLRDKQLNLVVTMRSNDAWLGLPYDLFTFTQIQRYVAQILGVKVGRYYHQAGSLHLYEKDFDRAGMVALYEQERRLPEAGMESYPLTQMPAWVEAYFLGMNLYQFHGEILNTYVAGDAADPAWWWYLRLLATRFAGSWRDMPEPYRTLMHRREAMTSLAKGEEPV